MYSRLIKSTFVLSMMTNAIVAGHDNNFDKELFNLNEIIPSSVLYGDPYNRDICEQLDKLQNPEHYAAALEKLTTFKAKYPQEQGVVFSEMLRRLSNKHNELQKELQTLRTKVTWAERALLAGWSGAIGSFYGMSYSVHDHKSSEMRYLLGMLGIPVAGFFTIMFKGSWLNNRKWDIHRTINHLRLIRKTIKLVKKAAYEQIAVCCANEN